MSNKKIVHYNMDEIDKIGANYNLIWGERSNGKSYQVKHKKGRHPQGVDLFVSVGYYFLALLSTTSRSRAAKASKDMAPRSSPER